MLKQTVCDRLRVDSLLEKGVGPLNEDHCCISENLFAVFDGATSLTGATYGQGRTGGYMAASLAGEAFSANDAPLHDLAGAANESIRRTMERHGVDLADRGGLWSTSAAAVRVLEDHFEWTQIGDCVVCVIAENNSLELLSPGFDHDLETLELWKNVCHSTDEPIHAAVAEKILEVRTRMNVTYGVLNGEPQAMNFLRGGERSLEGVRHIVLFTDGLFVPCENPENKGDFSRFAELFLDGGLPAVRDHVRGLEETDPGCRTYPRFKAHDDVAAIAISL